ncbi:MAG: VWA domain-containing protein [Chloroflexi bacterium]|nr:VWA domain-containing protein [Chloroflexota bacterium]
MVSAARTARAVRRAIRDERGQALPLMLAAVMLCTLFGVLVVDLGLMFTERRAAQSAADLAALAAAQDLPVRATDPQFAARIDTATATAISFLAANGYEQGVNGRAVSVVTTYGGDPAHIEVTAGRTVPWLFGRLLGLANPRVNARAVAAANAQPRDVALVLDRSGSMCVDTHGGPMLTCPSPPGDPDRNGRADWEPFDTMRVAANAFGGMLVPTAGSSVLDRVALVSFSTDATLDLALTNNFLAGSPYTTAIGVMVPAGYTNTAAAMMRARGELESRGRLEAARIIVLLSDGYANRYRSGGTTANPTYSTCASANGCAAADNDVLAQARLAAAQGFQIYTIGYTNRSGAALLQAVASIGANEGGGGQFFAVDNPLQLRSTFEQISALTSVALIE